MMTQSIFRGYFPVIYNWTRMMFAITRCLAVMEDPFHRWWLPYMYSNDCYKYLICFLDYDLHNYNYYRAATQWVPLMDQDLKIYHSGTPDTIHSFWEGVCPVFRCLCSLLNTVVCLFNFFVFSFCFATKLSDLLFIIFYKFPV